MRGLARECRKWAAHWAWQLERIVARTYQGGLRRGCRKSRCDRVEHATKIAAAAENASRARSPSKRRSIPSRRRWRDRRPLPRSALRSSARRDHADGDARPCALAHPRGTSREENALHGAPLTRKRSRLLRLTTPFPYLMMAKPLVSGKSLVAVARCRGAGHLAIGAGSTAPADLSSEAARCLSK